MSDRYIFPVHRKGACTAFVWACLLLPAQLYALDVGFQGLLSLEGSDNVEGANAPDEQDGSIQSAVIGVYGEQRSRLVTAAFSGELDTRKTASRSDSNINSVSRFLGAAEFQITPRSWTWYVGNILGGVRTDNAIQPLDDAELERRNVFATGPAFEYEQQGISRTSARLLYVNQTQNNEALEDLFVANLRHERDLTTGSYFGARLGNVYTDLPEQDDDLAEDLAEPDFNRSTFGVFYNRRIGFLSLFGELGATRYDADDESLDGLNAELRATQELGPQTSASLFVRRDLNDQSLSTAESLLQNSEAAVGIAPDSAGFFTETRVGAEYSYQGTDVSVDLLAGFAELDYALSSGGAQGADFDAEDRQQGFASAFWSKRLSQQLRSELGFNYETQDFLNRADTSESVLARATLVYSLSRSFDVQFSVTHDTGTGIRTRFVNSVGGGFIENEDIDVTENRFAIGLRWAPPSRASQELTVELKSLLQ